MNESKGEELTSNTARDLDLRMRHIGIAVPELEPAAEMLSALMGYRIISGPFDDPLQKVRVLFLGKHENDPAEIELVAPLSNDSPVNAMLTKGKGGAYHLCFETPDLDAALQHARQNGCVVVAEPVPAVAFAGRRIAWIYTSTRQLFELVEAAPTDSI